MIEVPGVCSRLYKPMYWLGAVLWATRTGDSGSGHESSGEGDGARPPGRIAPPEEANSTRASRHAPASRTLKVPRTLISVSWGRGIGTESPSTDLGREWADSVPAGLRHDPRAREPRRPSPLLWQGTPGRQALGPAGPTR